MGSVEQDYRTGVQKTGVSPLTATEVAIAMDESTQKVLEKLVDALEQRVRLQLKPIEDRLQEIHTEVRAHREQVRILETVGALSKERITRYEQDLNHGLARVREDMETCMKRLERKISDKNKLMQPAFAALAGVTTVLLGLFIWWMQQGAQ
jgi:chromosome segregation ATPase